MLACATLPAAGQSWDDNQGRLLETEHAVIMALLRGSICGQCSSPAHYCGRMDAVS